MLFILLIVSQKTKIWYFRAGFYRVGDGFCDFGQKSRKIVTLWFSSKGVNYIKYFS